MRIIQVINSLAAGGAEVFASQLSIELARNGHDVYLLTYAGILDAKGKSLDSLLRSNNVKVIHFNRKNNFLSRFIYPFFFLSKTIRKINPDIIHAHLQMSDVYVGLNNILNFRKRKIVRTLHNSRGPTNLPKFLDAILFKIYDKNIACSDYVKKNYANEKLRKLLISIPNGIDLSLLKDSVSDKSSIRKMIGWPEDIPIFINIGRMNRFKNTAICLKNQGFIIETIKFNRIKEKYMVVFLGDGELKKDFENMSKVAGLDDIVKFEGSVVSPYNYIAAADFCLMPSINEGLPISLIEAVCTGLYSVTSNIEAFQPFQTKSVYQLNTFEVEEFSNVMENIVKNKDKYVKLGHDNIAFFKSKFGIQEVAKKYLLNYK